MNKRNIVKKMNKGKIRKIINQNLKWKMNELIMIAKMNRRKI